MKYCFDLDNTLCSTIGNDYKNSKPYKQRIKHVNSLFEQGNVIIIYTARGMGTFNSNISLVYQHLFELTKKQLVDWGIKYHNLILGKPSYDIFVCDKAYNSDYWFDRQEQQRIKTGLIAGCFDVLHPGYMRALETCARHCDKLVVALHEDPSLENNKKPPILTVEERKQNLLSIRFVDDVVIYKTESDLVSILSKNIDIRFLGDDYVNKNYTGKNLNIPVYFLNRNHGWSATKFKKLIYEQQNS